MYWSGKDYEAISKALGLRLIILRAIKHWTVNFPWLAYQNYPMRVSKPHPGKQKLPITPKALAYSEMTSILECMNNSMAYLMLQKSPIFMVFLHQYVVLKITQPFR